MIEFKAECGHTIRAKDGDEGKVVRCSYCGRTTQVPDKADDEFASLFSDVVDLEAGESVSSGEAVKVKRRRPPDDAPKPGRKRESGAGFNPFAVVLKMAYAAAIVIVVIVCAKAAYTRLTSRPAPGPTTQAPTSGDDSTARPGSGPSQKRLNPGPQITLPRLRGNDGGIYIRSVPDKAEVRYRKMDVSQEEEIFLDPDANAQHTPCALQMDPGLWEVAVALRIDSPKLNAYPGYRDQRRYAELREEVQPLDDFFLPDQARELALVDSTQGWRMVVRKYECRVVKMEWLQLTALFMPNVTLSDLLPHLPAEPFFGFDESYVRDQLDYYAVPEQDRGNVIDALRKVGMVVYRYEDSGEYRCFMISLKGHVNTPPCETRGGGW